MVVVVSASLLPSLAPSAKTRADVGRSRKDWSVLLLLLLLSPPLVIGVLPLLSLLVLPAYVSGEGPSNTVGIRSGSALALPELLLLLLLLLPLLLPPPALLATPGSVE